MTTIESLPLEILQLICLDLCFEWKESICSFALANKRCFYASSAALFRSIRIVPEKDLNKEVVRWTYLLGSRASYCSVRQLEIGIRKPTPRLEQQQNGSFGATPPPEPLGEDFWKPLVKLVLRLQGLRDIIYDYPHIFPLCLLDTLHQSLPRCKLHIHDFGLSGLISLRRRIDEPVNAHENAIASSSCLHSIVLFTPLFKGGLKLHELRLLVWARSYNFTSLKTVVLDFSHIVNGTDLDEGVGSFLQSLPPLDELTLKGAIMGRLTFQAIVDCHHSLQKLILLPEAKWITLNISLSADNVSLLCERCPGLKELAIRIYRTQGDKEEVRLYRKLGSLPGLTSLQLLLDCFNPAKHPYDFLGWETREAVRDKLINSAVDKPLATSILRTIVQAQWRRGKPSLETLDLESIWCNYGNSRGVFRHAANVIQHDWTISRTPVQPDVGVMYHVQGADPDNNLGVQFIRTSPKTPWNENALTYRVFRELWPRKTSYFAKDWKSFPLATD